MVSIQTSIDQATFEETSPQSEKSFLFRCMSCNVESYPWHWHYDVELFTLLNGSLRYDVPGQSEEYEEGDVGFVNANVLHKTTNPVVGSCVQMQSVFSPRIIAGEIGGAIDRRYVQPLLHNHVFRLVRIPASDPAAPELRRRIFSVQENYRHKTYGYEMRIRSELCSVWFILLEMLKASAQETVSIRRSADEDRIRAMLSFIETNYTEKTSLEEISAAAQVCPREASRCFVRQLGISPIAYLLTYRLSRATDLLRQSRLTITEISMNCGFNSVSYFSKMFQRQFGMSPSEYRALCKLK